MTNEAQSQQTRSFATIFCYVLCLCCEVAEVTFEFSRNTRSWQHRHFCTTSNGNKWVLLQLHKVGIKAYKGGTNIFQQKKLPSLRIEQETSCVLVGWLLDWNSLEMLVKLRLLRSLYSEDKSSPINTCRVIWVSLKRIQWQKYLS